MVRSAWCAAALAALSLSGPISRAETAGAGADRLCGRAVRAEKDAGDFERKSVERRRFLEGLGGGASPGDAAPAAVPSAVAASIRAQAAQARQLLPTIRKGIAAAEQDRGVVPGLSAYFRQMEMGISSALQAVDACLAAPERCNPPPAACPVPPDIPVYRHGNASADMIRHIQSSYRQAANEARQACLALNAAVSRDLSRLKREGRAAGAASSAGPGTQRFGETDLYLVKAGNLRREAAQLRLDADRASGVPNYCSVGPRAAAAASSSGAPAESAGRGLPYGGKVADLKAGWDSKWSKGPLAASDVPLPEGSAAAGEAPATDRIREYLGEKAPWWWYKTKSLYREADEQVGLTEFIKSRPVELVKDVAVEYVNNNFGSIGRSMTTGYKILGVAKSTSDEVGEILVAAPQVIAHGGADDARKLYDRSNRVPLKVYNEMFDDVVGKFPAPRYESGGGKGISQ